MLYVGIIIYPTVRQTFLLQWRWRCYVQSAYFVKRNVTFIKLDRNDVNMTTQLRYWFARYNCFDCCSLNEIENLLNLWWNIFFRYLAYVTRENIAFYDRLWNKFISYTDIQQISSIYTTFYYAAILNIFLPVTKIFKSYSNLQNHRQQLWKLLSTRFKQTCVIVDGL